MKKFFSLLLLIFSVLTFSQDRFEKIDNYLNYLYENHKFMGSLCIREGENVVFNKAYGFADVGNNITADRTTKYKIGSVTKTFTSVMILQLIEERKLRLETKLNKFFPKVKNAETITISDLLYQRTGIPDYIDYNNLTKIELNTDNIKEAIYNEIESFSSNFSPNNKHEYSNSNYYLLGGILEKVTGKSFSENLQERIVKRAKLINTYYKTSKIDTSVNESYSFTFNENEWKKTPEWKNDIAFASGGIIATPADLTRFISALFEGNLLNEKSLTIMTSLKDGYGAGIQVAPFGDRKYFAHAGGIENFRSLVSYNNSEKTSIAFIINGDNYNRNDITIAVLSIYYKLPFPFPTFQKINSELIQKYSGSYSSEQLPIKIKIFEKNEELFAEATDQNPFPLTIKKENTFIFAPAGIEIQFHNNGFFLLQGGQKFIFTKE